MPFISGFDYLCPAIGQGKPHDLYCLGVISLEIFYWKPIEDILSDLDLQEAELKQALLKENGMFMLMAKSVWDDMTKGPLPRDLCL